MNVYFDNAATTPIRKEVIDSISSVMNDSFGNPSSTHAFGRNAKKYVETARKKIASLLNASPKKLFSHLVEQNLTIWFYVVQSKI